MSSLVIKFIFLTISSAILVQGLNLNTDRIPNYDHTKCFDKDGEVLPIEAADCLRIEKHSQCFIANDKIRFLSRDHCDQFNHLDCYIKDGKYVNVLEKLCVKSKNGLCIDKDESEVHFDRSSCKNYNDKNCYEKNGKFFPTFVKDCIEPTPRGCKTTNGDAVYTKGVCDSYNK